MTTRQIDSGSPLFQLAAMGLLDLIKNFKNNTGHEIRILLLGLDNAGKTTILKQLSTESVDNVTPTKGFNVKSVVACGDIRLNIWDLGGQRAIRPYWSNYFDQTDALIYVIDSSDRKRFDETNLELMDLLDEEKLANVPVLVFANKQDIATAATHAEVGKYLKLTDLRGRSWHIAPCSALSGEGLKEGMNWLGEQIKDKRVVKEDLPKGKKK